MTQEDFFKRYTFNTETDHLGEGGFGEVFKAYDTHLDRWVAIKKSQVKKGQENFTLQKEVELATKLPTHPNIAHYEACYRFTIPMAGTFDFGILQYYEEGNLSNLRKAGKVNAGNLNQILEGILSGLSHLHKHNIIHRDIKPANILMVKRGTTYIPKITDFGISKQGSDAAASAISNSLAGGTYSYAAPEQLKGESKMRRNADLWSFGVILYELLTYKLPFEATSSDKSSEAARNEVTSLILEGKLPEDIEVIERPYREIIIYCLEVNPNERIKSAAQLLELLKGRPAEEVEIKTGPTETSQASGPQAEITKVKPAATPIKEENSPEINPSPTHNPSKSFIEKVNGIDLEMIYVQGGSFLMGSENVKTNEYPVHRVDLDGFFIGKFPVTQALWKAVMNNNPSWFQQGRILKRRIFNENIILEDDTSLFPVEQVSWKDAQEFIEKLNRLTRKKFRLPTEAEWEYAAKGGSYEDIEAPASAFKYSGSNNIDEVSWYYDNSRQNTHSVGEKKANKLGLYDMTGNVWEWCNDLYRSNYYKSSPRSNPQGAYSGSRRVIRGGSWFGYANYIRATCRDCTSPDYRSSGIGFRLVTPKLTQ